MFNNLFIISSSGEVLIEKHWIITNVKRHVCEMFMEYANKVDELKQLDPIIITYNTKYYLIHILRNNITYLTVIEKETNPLMIIEIQHFIVNIFIEYFKTVNETTIRSNFSTIYQILDEVIDGGFPYTTEMNQLKEMILPPSLTRRMFENVTGKFAVTNAMPIGALSKTPWRKNLM